MHCFLCTAGPDETMADTSPEWKKPADVMKFCRRKSLCTNLNATRTSSSPRSRLSLETCSPGRKGQKRKNPFAYCSSSAKMEDNDESKECRDNNGVAETEMKHAEAVPASNCFIDVLVSMLYYGPETDLLACGFIFDIFDY